MLSADFSTVNVVRRISTLSSFLGVEVLTPQLSKLVFLSQRVRLTELLSISELLSS